MARACRALSSRNFATSSPVDVWRRASRNSGARPAITTASSAALTPRPRVNLILYRGLLAPRAAWRRASCRRTTTQPSARPLNRSWAELMQRGFPPSLRLRRASGFDVLACPRCPGRLTLVALIRDPAVIQRILRHLRLSADLPVMRAGRDPPLLPVGQRGGRRCARSGHRRRFSPPRPMIPARPDRHGPSVDVPCALAHAR